MADRRKTLHPDYLFDIFKLNKWFAIGSIFLFIAVAAMILKDYNREWKQWQRKFRILELERTEAQIGTEKETLANNPEYQAAREALKAANSETRKQDQKIFEINKRINKLLGEKYGANGDYQELKAESGALRYKLEEARAHMSHKAGSLRKKLRKLDKEVLRARINLDRVDSELKQVKKELEKITATRDAAQSNVDTLTASLKQLERKRKKVARSFVNDFVRDGPPLLDFVAPAYKIREVIVSDLTDDYNFAKIPRADACMTCHIAIDKEGYEKEANPLRTHPNLDIFLSSKSPHPVDDYGCTICHAGLHGGLTFTTAGHTPQSKRQAKTWKKNYDWHRQEHWEEPMLPLPQTEATCYGCHQAEIEVPKGEKINKGINLIERYGCYGCHKIEGWELIRKTGPSLERVAGKLDHDFLTKWIRNPKQFRPSTNMPVFFDQSNTSNLASSQRSTVEVQGIVSYLLEKSKPYTAPEDQGFRGNAERGKELFGTIGCLGCHNIDDYPSQLPYKNGPDLSGIGSKVSAPWLAEWLKDPKKYWPETVMPNLRLSDSEVADLTTYLTSKNKKDFDSETPKKLQPSVINQIVIDHLEKRMPIAEARKKLGSMSKEEKLLLIGEKSIVHYGCHGCHVIPGFENAKPIGTELTKEASKPLSRFDFGMVDMEHTVEGFLHQKIMEPRVFDQGRIRNPLEKLRMPNFKLDESEGEAILTFLLGLREYDIPEGKIPAVRKRYRAIPDGRRLVRHLNCRGCHILEGMGGDILGHYEDPSAGPPNLIGEGKKVQQEWLYHFLQAPETVRPWLKTRMPTFGLDDLQTNTLIAYFRALDNLDVKIEKNPSLETDPAQVAFGREVFTQFQCLKCHVSGKIPDGVETSNLAPDFRMTKKRLRYEWMPEWLRDPQELLPGTRMPNFFYYDGEPMFPDASTRIDAVRDHIYSMK